MYMTSIGRRSRLKRRDSFPTRHSHTTHKRTNTHTHVYTYMYITSIIIYM